MKPTELNLTPDQKLAQNVEISTLCAFYGGLLTERQRTALKLHYDEDWSLAEIADHLSVSRQNVHDLITRSAQKLRHYEEVVGGIAQARRTKAQLCVAITQLEAAQKRASSVVGACIGETLGQIKQIMTDIDGEE